MNYIFNLDTNIMLSVNDFISNNLALQKFFASITLLGNDGILWILIALVLLFFKKLRKYGIILIIALILGILIGNGIFKNIVQRQRPFQALGLDLFIPMVSGFSFPSGHSLSSFIAATVIFQFNKKFGILAIILAVLISISRIFVLVHYPSDVIVGAILGIIIGVVTFKFLVKRLK